MGARLILPPQNIGEAIINALSLRYMSASEGSAERPKAASVAQIGQPYGRPARGDIEAKSTAYPCLA